MCPSADGVVQVHGAEYLVLQDMAADYQTPCVLDIKVGLTVTPSRHSSMMPQVIQQGATACAACIGFWDGIDLWEPIASAG